jgi:RimJ/RimL family protein N-acetyltransferase
MAPTGDQVGQDAQHGRLRGDRVLLVPLTDAMAGRILSGERAPDWSAGFPTDGDVRISRVLGEHGHDPGHPFGPYTVTEVSSGLLIGGAGFFGPPGPDGEVEIGYGLAGEWRGRGLATEAAVLLVDLAFADPAVRVAVAHTAPGNAASQRVLARVGFGPAPRTDGGDDLRFEIRRPA